MLSIYLFYIFANVLVATKKEKKMGKEINVKDILNKNIMKMEMLEMEHVTTRSYSPIIKKTIKQDDFIAGEVSKTSKERDIWQDPDIVKFMSTGKYPEWDREAFLLTIK